MSAAIAASEEHSVRATGSRTTVPDHDVCRLSYYLRCCTLGCGVDIIVDDLVDFKKAHRLPKSKQNAIFELAANPFSASEMVNTTIFLDETGELCGDNENMFFELKKVTNLLAVSSAALIGGKQTQISKVMLFKPVWLERYYVEPLQRYKQQHALSAIQLLARQIRDIVVEDVTETSSLHCSHCKGLDAACGCEHGCEPKQTTQCSAVHHCDHCKGFEDGKCSCKKGCPPSKYSKCVVVHSSVSCDSCRVNSIQGPRYKCQKCFNYDLCEECYRAGRHEMTHPFSLISRVGSSPVNLESRERPRAIVGETKAGPSCEVAEKKSEQTVPTKSNTERSCPSFVGENMSIGEMKKYLEDNGVSYTGVREKRELLRLVWETQVESMGVKELETFIAEQCIEEAVAGGVGAKRRAAIAAFDSKYKPKQTVAYSVTFHQGDMVELCRLKKESMNGKLATVVRSELVNGRMQVQLVNDAKVRLNIRPEHLQAAPEDID